MICYEGLVMTYRISFTKDASADTYKLAKSEPAAYAKLLKLIEELKQHPLTGTGHPHALTGDRKGQWARSISKRHRLVYRVEQEEILILVISAYGHYDDK